MEMLKRFYEEEDGMETIEMVMIVAALMCVALLFRKQLISFVDGIIGTVFDKKLIEKPSADVPN